MKKYVFRDIGTLKGKDITSIVLNIETGNTYVCTKDRPYKRSLVYVDSRGKYLIRRNGKDLYFDKEATEKYNKKFN